MKKHLIDLFHIHSLRSFIIVVILGIVVTSLSLSGYFLFTRSAGILKSNYDQDILQQFDRINAKIDDRVALIDNLFPHLMSNMTIQENLEPTSQVFQNSSSSERLLTIERQVTSLILSNYLWNQKFINSIYIQDSTGCGKLISLKSQANALCNMDEAVSGMTDSPQLQVITTSARESSLYFARNIYSSNTGIQIASILIEIDQNAWESVWAENLDSYWLVYLFTPQGQLLNRPSTAEHEEQIGDLLSCEKLSGHPERYTLANTTYEIISQTLPFSGFTSVIAIPTDFLYQELNHTLKGYIVMFLGIIAVALLATGIISGLVTAPIKNMILQIKSISVHESQGLVSKGMYSEFHDLSDAFNELLGEREIYYSELYEKQLLLKNAEIKALQGQMDPHFLFNVLDSIAWKAALCDNEEIYQMVISLGEMMRMSIQSKESDLVTLEQELTYVQFYLHLQQTRFEGKYSVDISVEDSLLSCRLPCFSIQPLVENAIIHGLEPRKEDGRLEITVFEKNERLHVRVEDNGIGFPQESTLYSISNASNTHPHIGLKNLDRRLILLYGASSSLQISSRPNESTVVSFAIPIRKEP